jgi:hypothetical protein
MRHGERVVYMVLSRRSWRPLVSEPATEDEEVEEEGRP